MAFCNFWEDLGLDDFWILVIVAQIGFILIYMTIYYVFFRKRKYVTVRHMFVVYFNTSFWWWLIWILVSRFNCGYRVEDK